MFPLAAHVRATTNLYVTPEERPRRDPWGQGLFFWNWDRFSGYAARARFDLRKRVASPRLAVPVNDVVKDSTS